MASILKNKKNILFVCPVFPPYKYGGGQAQVAWDFAVGLQSKGYSVTVLTTQFAGLAQAERIHDIHIIRFTHYVSFLQQMGFYNPKGLCSWLYTHMHMYDIVFIHDIYTLYGFFAAKVAVKKNITYVLMPHGMGNISKQQHKVRLKKMFIALFANFVSLHATKIIFCSQNEKNDYALKYTDSIVIENGIDQSEWQCHLGHVTLEDQVSLRTKFHLLEKKVLLSMGRLVQAKRFDRLVTYIAPFLEKNDDYVLVIVGPDGGKKHHLQTLIGAMGLRNKVIIIDGLFGQDKYTIFSLAEMFLLSSDLEGFPIVICEAVASHLPCLLSPGCNIESINSKIEIFHHKTEFIKKIELLIRTIKYHTKHHVLYTESELKKFDLQETIDKIDRLFLSL